MYKYLKKFIPITLVSLAGILSFTLIKYNESNEFNESNEYNKDTVDTKHNTEYVNKPKDKWDYLKEYLLDLKKDMDSEERLDVKTRLIEVYSEIRNDNFEKKLEPLLTKEEYDSLLREFDYWNQDSRIYTKKEFKRLLNSVMS